MAENIERLIVRSLDGALTSDEEHELNRELIRDPEVRRLFDDYRNVDRLAEDALRAVREESDVNLDTVFDAARESSPQSRRLSWGFHRGWLMVPGAIAAALLAMMIPQPGLSPGIAPRHPATDARSLPYGESQGAWQFRERGLMQPVNTVPRTRSDTGREIIGVVGEDGNLYWIEVERTRTIRVPASREVGRSASDLM